jgi:CO dehydrogenase maturation factor
MEAGIEHLSRSTSQGVDLMLVVTEPGQRAIDCADSVIEMARDIGVKELAFVGNKVTGADDEEFIRSSLPGQHIIGFIPYSEAVRTADRSGKTAIEAAEGIMAPVIDKIIELIENKAG